MEKVTLYKVGEKIFANPTAAFGELCEHPKGTVEETEVPAVKIGGRYYLLTEVVPLR